MIVEIQTLRDKYEDFFMYVSKNINLSTAIKYIVKNNTSNFVPYHNLYHNLIVAELCYYIALEEKLTSIQINELILAGLFHDFNHSATNIPDHNNIFLALKGVTDFYKAHPNIIIDMYQIVHIIKATEYPYNIPHNKLNISQKIIRDADMLVIYDSNWFTLSLALHREKNISLHELFNNQIEFNLQSTFSTKIARKIRDTNVNNLIEKLKQMDLLFN